MTTDKDVQMKEADPLQKKRKTMEAASTVTSTSSQIPDPTSAIVQHGIPEPQIEAQLMMRDTVRLTMDFNPNYVKARQLSREVGYRRDTSQKKLSIQYFDINVTEFRRCIEAVLRNVLMIRFQEHGSLRPSEITGEIDTIVPLTVSACMCALYAKLRLMHRAYGPKSTRYTILPRYSKEVELPLPLAIAIQDFGSFETVCLPANAVLAPTYPEGTQHEGRASADFVITQYQSYVPTFKDLGIPCKSVDPNIKGGTAWWTYKVENSNSTSDLNCTLPLTMYTDLSAQVRSLFLEPAEDSDECSDIITHGELLLGKYGTRYREATRNSNVRAFLALCHGQTEEWSNGAPAI